MQAPITLEVLGAIVAILCGIGGVIYMIRSADLERFRGLEKDLAAFKLEASEKYVPASTASKITDAVHALRMEIAGELKEMRAIFNDALVRLGR